MGIDQGKLQRASSAAGRLRLDAEDDAEGVAAAAGPAIAGPGLYVGPIAFRIGLADDEKAIIAKARVISRRECEPGGGAVLDANPPEGVLRTGLCLSGQGDRNQ